MTTVFFVPVYNQVRELPVVLAEFAAVGDENVQLLLVNNGSTDGSEAIVRESGHEFIDLPRNLGVGGAYLAALQWADAAGVQTFGTMAANGKMLPAEIPQLLEPIRSGDAQYVTGSRFLPGGASPNLPEFRRRSIPLVNSVVRATTGAKVTDATCGFRAFDLDIFRRAEFDLTAPWLRTYGLEYYLYAKVLLDGEIVWTERAVTMRYPAKGPYSKIRAGRDWYAMLKPWIAARFDRRGFRPAI